ncbi:MAG: TIGR03757 family integrating conjugative element protein [Pseudomonadales bacterium]
MSTQVLILAVAISITAQQSVAETSEYPQSIVVITSDQHPINEPSLFVDSPASSKPAITLLNLDAVSDFERRLGEGLPADETQARVIIEQRITERRRVNVDAELRAAYQGLAVAMQYGLDRYPAIIFDQRAVVYGVTDLPVAIEKYRTWSRQKKRGAINDD